jgi:hypothetical protein
MYIVQCTKIVHVLADQAFTNVFVSCMKLALHTEMDVSIKEIPGRTLLFFVIHLQQILAEFCICFRPRGPVT